MASTVRHRERRHVVELRRERDSPKTLAPAYAGSWTELPPKLSVHELTVLAHAFNGYMVAEAHLGRDAFEVGRQLTETFRADGRWEGTVLELLAGFFAIVRGWRGHYDYPEDGDPHHQEAQSLYEAIVRRLREQPDEVEFKLVADGA